ncbi:MAG: CpsB/CapC family capsule biosynthesis tyrosine phosphatase, partial [Dehalococcoidia bacterium]
LVERFVGRGCYTQITAMSLLGGMGPDARKTAEHLLRQGLVHTVASDMHRPSGNRQPMPEGTFERLCELAGEETARLLLYDNPAAVLAGKPLAHAQSVAPRKRRWWMFGF